MKEIEPISSDDAQAIMVFPETQGTPESLESLDKLVHLFRKRQISFEEYYAKMKQHSSLITNSSEVNEIRLKREFDIKPTNEETMHAFNLESELTREYLTSQLTLPQFRFLQDTLSFH